jgi:thiol-disulfide isomerase/thioredoxin
MKATLHGEVLDDLVTMKTLFEQLKADFPGTQAATTAERTLQALERRAKAKEASAALVGKAAPPLNFQWSTRDGLKTLADLKGKVVVLDFWATWCGPCISSFPQVRELTAHYQGLDVVVLGVTSIQGSISGLQPQRIDTKGDPKKEFSLMADFIKAKDVTWTVVFSQEEVFNPDYGITGIPHMAIVAPDGTLRHTGLHPAMPHAEKTEKIDALLKEFKLPTAATSGVKKS